MKEKYYLKNLFFFKNNYPLIYSDIVKLVDFNKQDILIDKNILQKTKFISKQNYQKLLNNSSNIISLIQQKQIDFRKSFDLEIDSYDFINQFIQKIDFKNIQLSSYKAIVCGINLGFDIKNLSKNKKIKAILILEDDINLIYLSLYFIKYYKIKQKIFFNDIKSFLDYKYKLNHFIKYIDNDRFYLDKFIRYIKLHNPLNYTFSEYLVAYKKSLINVNRYKMLDFKNSYIDKPILFLGAGSSLEDNIDNIKKYKDKFFIVAIGSILKLLEQKDIIPDMIISIDGSKKIIKQFDISDKFIDIPMIFSTETDTDILEKFKNIYLIQTNIATISDFVFSGHTIADIGIEILFLLSKQDIYILGFDFGGDYSKGYIGNSSSDFSQAKYFFKEKLLKYQNKLLINLSYNDIVPKISFKDINISNFSDNSYRLVSYKIKAKKNKIFLKEIIKKYDTLIKPYLNILKDKKLYKKQIDKIKKYFKTINF